MVKLKSEQKKFFIIKILSRNCPKIPQVCSDILNHCKLSMFLLNYSASSNVKKSILTDKLLLAFILFFMKLMKCY